MKVQEEAMHALARAFMDTRPNLKSLSLDEWMVEHDEVLTPAERATGHAILSMFAERGFV